MRNFFGITLIYLALICVSFISMVSCSDKSDQANLSPSSLEETNRLLDDLLDSKTKIKLQQKELGDFDLHMGLGLLVRNKWVYGEGSPIARKIHDLGIKNPDDISSVILASYKAKLRGEVFDLEQFTKIIAAKNNHDYMHKLDYLKAIKIGPISYEQRPLNVVLQDFDLIYKKNKDKINTINSLPEDLFLLDEKNVDLSEKRISITFDVEVSLLEAIEFLASTNSFNLIVLDNSQIKIKSFD